MKTKSEIAESMLAAGDSLIDAQMKPLIEKWSNPPQPLEILEVLDKCIHGALAADFVVQVLQVIYDEACQREGVTHKMLEQKATWRKELGG